MFSVIASIISLIGSGITGFFGVKKAQADTIQSSLAVLGRLNDSDAQSQIACAQAINSIVTQGSPLERMWRPLLMCIFGGIVVSFWFGHVPPNLNGPMSPMLQEIFDILKIGIGGYIPCRTIDKLITQMNIGSILKTFIAKKIA